MPVSRNRDIATILGKTEAANTSNTALGTGSGGGVDSAGTLALVGFEKDVFRVNNDNISSSHTIDSADRAMSAGPVTVDSGVTITINGYWSVV